MADVVEMIQLSPTMEEGRLVAWLKKEGDTVKTGDLIAEVETDKATMEMESFFDGVLLKILVPAGEAVPVGRAMAIIGTQDSRISVGVPAASALVVLICRFLSCVAAQPAGAEMKRSRPRRWDRKRATIWPRTLLPASSSGGAKVPSAPLPGETVTMPPPMPLLPGSPIS